MKITVVRGDITRQDVEAVVTAANTKGPRRNKVGLVRACRSGAGCSSTRRGSRGA